MFTLLTPRPVRCLLFEIFRDPKIGEELAYWQRAKGAPGRAFVLDVKRAFLVAKKAGAEGATPEAPAVPMEVDKAAAEERTRSLSATPLPVFDVVVRGGRGDKVAVAAAVGGNDDDMDAASLGSSREAGRRRK